MDAVNALDQDPRERFGHDMYFDRNGVPLTLRQWAEHTEDNSYRVVLHDDFDSHCVSTLWIGLDMGLGFLHGGPPMIFETNVVPIAPSRLWDIIDQRRYHTEEQARAGHAEICAELRARGEGG